MAIFKPEQRVFLRVWNETEAREYEVESVHVYGIVVRFVWRVNNRLRHGFPDVMRFTDQPGVFLFRYSNGRGVPYVLMPDTRNVSVVDEPPEIAPQGFEITSTRYDCDNNRVTSTRWVDGFDSVSRVKAAQVLVDLVTNGDEP